MLLVNYSVQSQITLSQYLDHNHALLSIVSNKRQIQKQRQPISIYQEKEGEKGLNSGFGDNVRVEAIAEIDGIDIVTTTVSAVDLSYLAAFLYRIRNGWMRLTILDRCTL